MREHCKGTGAIIDMTRKKLYKGEVLLRNIKKKLPELEKLLVEVEDHWAEIDCIYRFYHCSFKVYWIQGLTKKIVDMLKKLAPENTKINSMFEQIYKEGQVGGFKSKHNKDWMKYTRPQLESYFHAKYFLRMAIKYGKELEHAPECLPSGWAALLYLFSLRYEI